jgi:hypothetical protein
MNPFSNPKIQVMRVPTNPLDKSTIVSIYPKDIDTNKPTITPCDFHIPAGSEEKPSVTVIGPASWFKEMEENQPWLEIVEPSVVVARSIIEDYVNGLHMSDGVDSMPGLFWLPGSLDLKTIVEKHKNLLDRAKEVQRNYWLNLVNAADALWARTNGQPNSISLEMKLAAAQLNITAKEWLKNQQTAELMRCVACGQLVDSKVIVCPNCKVVLNEAAFQDLKLTFAK